MLDADDTLWWLEELYDRARQHARQRVEEAGLDGASWEARERKLDVANVARMGLSPDRFPMSCVTAYLELAHETGVRADPGVACEIDRRARQVFTWRARNVDGVERVLKELSQVATLALLTKGDTATQLRRLADSGVASMFAAVAVVAEKDEDAFRAVLRDAEIRPAEAWSIGNSLRSDVIPALNIGMRAVWVDSHVWEYERAAGQGPADPYAPYKVGTLQEAAALILCQEFGSAAPANLEDLTSAAVRLA